MRKPHHTPACLIPCMILCCSLAAAPATLLKSGPGLHSAMPAGYDVLTIKPANATLSLMGLIECPELEGAQHTTEGLKSKVIAADGTRMQQFPRHFNFRITASLRKIVLDGPAAVVNVPGDPRALLLNLKFRIKAYHGLEMHEITPESVEMIGIPADVPSDERIYRIGVDIGKMPVTNRIVIQIISPEGELLTHFPFTLL